MKTLIERITSVALSVALATSLFGAPASAYAADNAADPGTSSPTREEVELAVAEAAEPANQAIVGAAPSTGEDTEEEWAPKSGDYTDAYWDINVTIVDARGYVDRENAQAPVYTVSLTGSDTGSVPTTKTLATDKDLALEGSVIYTGMFSYTWRSGETYTVSVSDAYDPFAKFEQEITRPADGRDYELVLYAGKIDSLPGKAKGSIIYGDYNDDKVVDGRDAARVIDSIEGKIDTVYDLRHDGSEKTDLVDLAILATQIGNEQKASDNHAAEILGYDTANGDARVKDGSVVTNTAAIGANKVLIAEDNLVDIVNNSVAQKIFAVAAQNNTVISEKNPVSIEVNNLQSSLTQDKVVSAGESTSKAPTNTDEVMVQGMRITSDAVGKVTDGYITAYYDDEKGKEQSIMVPFSESMKDIYTQSEFSVDEAGNPLAELAGAGIANINDSVKQAQAAPGGSAATNSKVENGVIVVNFGKLIAVKKVSLTFTKTEVPAAEAAPLNLAAISSVEFLNDMASYVGEAEMNIPTNMNPFSKRSMEFTVEWDRQDNVDGYEISITALGATEIVYVKQTNEPTQSKVINTFKAGKKGKVQNNVEYSVKVQSVNQSWRSGWCDPKTVMPKADKPPKAPEYITAKGGVRVINVSWKAADDAETYTIFYRVMGSNEAWSKMTTENVSAAITGLPDNTDYEIYLTASNELGESGKSTTQVARTLSLTAANLMNYKLINKKDAAGNYVENIESATLGSTNGVIYGDSPLNTGKNSVMCLFDNNPDTYFSISDWDMGGSYNVGSHGVNVKFKTPQTVGFISFAASVQNITYSSALVHYWDEKGQKQRLSCPIIVRDGGNNRTYNVIQLPKKVTTDRILVGLSRYVRLIDIAEMRFHEYDTVYDEILGLYEDDSYITLQRKYANDADRAAKTNAIPETSDERTARLKPQMDQLKTRLETNDPSSGEPYPMKQLAMAELNYAYQLLEDENKGLSDSVKLHGDLADAYDNGKNLGIGGLNAWQPLQHVTFENKTLIAYVNLPGGKKGGGSKVDLYIGQNHGESSMAPKRIGTLAAGRSIFLVPDSVFNTALTEHGGQMYAVYTGGNPNEKWSVRLLGAEKIPSLDLLNVTDQAEREKRVDTYLSELGDHVNKLNANHSTMEHKAGTMSYGYKAGECITNATDIMLDKIMYSVPADEIWSASKQGNRADFLRGCDALDQQMKLFYQHKGFMDEKNDDGSKTGATGSNIAPNRHLNIRYMTMFAGAFMYAAGNHIGVDRGSCGGLGYIVPVDKTAPGEVPTKGTYLGWGESHEIGHNINDGRYAYAEVTNNYFAQMAQTISNRNADPSKPYGSTRFSYANVYKHLASDPLAHAGNVFTQLAMYWQLMLAYDSHELSTLYDNYKDLSDNRFVARMDAYARNPKSFTGEVPLTFTSEQQNVIRLASAAAGKDLSGFFTAWGFKPDATTKAFVAQFPEETRAVQYGNENTAHRLEVNGVNNAYASLAGVAALNDNSVKLSVDGSLVTIDVTPTVDKKDVHGVEISRITYSSGVPKTQIIGFAQEKDGKFSFTDDATFVGNRCVQYQVSVIDKHLNRSNTVTTAQEKLNGNGLYDRTGWTVSTNMATQYVDAVEQDTTVDADALECETEKKGAKVSDATAILDVNRQYIGRANDADPYVIIDTLNMRAIEHLSYTPVNQNQAIDEYVVELSPDGLNWMRLAEGKANYEDIVNNGWSSGKKADIYFPEKESGSVDYINTERSRFIKVTAVGAKGRDVSFQSLLVYGPSGDNIEITNAAIGNEGQSIPAFGKLNQRFIFDQGKFDSTGGKEGFIPKDAIVFTGSFTGNPAYNVVVLYNDRGEIVGGSEMVSETITENGKEYVVTSEKLKSEQIILAPKPNLGQSFGQTSSGRWIYWITDPSQMYEGMQVRAELYRVDNAFTNQGQRLTADCKLTAVKNYEQLDPIRFNSDTADLLQ